jgi:hypothetical protein
MMAFFEGPLEKVHFIIIAVSCVGIYANLLCTTSLYLNFTDTHIVEEDFTKTICIELNICRKLKVID